MSHVTSIIGGTVLTVTHGTVPNAMILLRDGKIESVGAGVTVPPADEIVDASGRFITPGLIDCHSHLAMKLSDSVPRWWSLNEVGTVVSSMTGVEDVFDPSDVNIYRTLAGGVTVANLLHGSANPIGGKNLVVKLRWGRQRLEDFAIEGAPPGIKFALGENPKLGGGGAGSRPIGGPLRYPATRMGVEYVIRDAFARAAAYQREWLTYECKRRDGQPAVPPRRDLQLDPLVEVLACKRLVHAHAYRADEMLALMRLAEELGFRIRTFQHALEAYKIADEIADHGAGVSTFADWWGHKLETVDGIPYNAALLARKGIVVSVHSDSAERSRRLNTEAAKAIKWGGVTDDAALAMVTINPARQLGIDARVGSIEAGKDADLVIWSAHPLSSYAVVDRVYIEGEPLYDRLDEAQRLVSLAHEKSALLSIDQQASGALPSVDVVRPGGNRLRRRVGVPQPVRRSQAPTGCTPARRRGLLAITNARIFSIVRPPFEGGTLVMRDGLIESVGTHVTIPQDAQIIDVEGRGVYPGLIDARSTLGLNEPGPVGFGDARELLEFNPQLRTHVAYHSDSAAIAVARANGITTVAVAPSGGVLSGQVAVMNLDGRTWEESTVSASAGVAFQFPSVTVNGTGAPGKSCSYVQAKRERDERLCKLTWLLDDARAYANAGATGARDLVLESLTPIVEGRAPLFTRVDGEEGIREAIAFADRENIRIVITGGLESEMVAPLLSERNIPVIFGPVFTLPLRDDSPHHSTFTAAGELSRAGVKVAFATGDTQDVRLLPYHAAQSVAWGLARGEALKALTLNAAEILGVDDRLGTIEAGKIANVIITGDDPLEVRSEVLHVVIAGRDVGLDNRQRSLYERYLDRP